MTDQIIDHTKLAGATASPFLPGTKIQYAWDSTCLGYIKTCGRLYQYTIIEGWVPKDESIHLRFGNEYHKTLEEYDHARVRQLRHEDALREAIHNLLIRIADWDPDTTTKAGHYKNCKSIVQITIDYLDHFNQGGDNDPAETYILDSGKPAVELSFRFELDWGPKHRQLDTDGNELETYPAQPYLLCGHLDRVVNFNNQLLVMDRKTTTQTPGDYYFKQFEPNNQMTLYTLAGKLVLKSPIRGVVIDAGQVLLEKPNKFIRGFTFRTPAQLEEWLLDLRLILNEAEGYANMNYWPMRDTSCGNFGGCRFRDVCSKDPSVRENFLKADFIKLAPEDRWNPMKPR